MTNNFTPSPAKIVQVMKRLPDGTSKVIREVPMNRKQRRKLKVIKES